jgi:hypothetical protein
VHNLYFVINDFQFGIVLLDVPDDVADSLVDMVVAVADTAYTQRGNLPQVMVIYFRNRNVVLVPQAGHQRLHNPTLLFQRMIFGKVYFNFKDSGVHRVIFMQGIL